MSVTTKIDHKFKMVAKMTDIIGHGHSTAMNIKLYFLASVEQISLPPGD